MRMPLLLLLLNLVLSANCNDQVLILKYNGREECSKSLVELPIKSAMKEFTYCGKYSLKFLKTSVLMGFDMNTYFGVQYEKKLAYLIVYGDIAWINLTSHSLKPDQWQHLCFSVSSSQVQIVLNGVILKVKTMHYTEVTFEKLWIGGILENKGYEKNRMEGRITGIHIWNETLEVKYLVSITSNNIGPNFMPPPALFSWQTLKMQSNTSCIEYIMLDGNDELFKKISEKNVLMEYLTDFYSSNYLCHAFGGKLLVPKTDKDLNEIKSFLIDSNLCSHALVGLKKINKTTVVDIDGQIAPFVKWHKTQPNGEEIEQCVSVYRNGYQFDIGCSDKKCFACQIKAKIIFTLRGNISDIIEREFFVDMTQKQKLEIRGLIKTECFWNNNTWNFGNNLKLDESHSTSSMPPVGVKQWNNGNLLKFTQCKKHEFTCHTYGHCIPMNERCDGHPDCPIDASDEKDCKIMTLRKGYDRKNPPAKNTTTLVSIKVFDIIDVNELDMSYKVYFKVTMKWFDSRIIFRNLKATDYENNLENLELDEIWTPNLYIGSSKNNYMKAQQDDEDIYVVVRVNRNGSPQQNELSEIDEDFLYPGNENSINMINYFQIKLGCKFDLKW